MSDYPPVPRKQVADDVVTEEEVIAYLDRLRALDGDTEQVDPEAAAELWSLLNQPRPAVVDVGAIVDALRKQGLVPGETVNGVPQTATLADPERLVVEVAQTLGLPGYSTPLDPVTLKAFVYGRARELTNGKPLTAEQDRSLHDALVVFWQRREQRRVA